MRRVPAGVSELDGPGGGFPRLRQVVLDCTDARALAEFYRRLLGLRYRPGDEAPQAGEPDPNGQDWLVLQDAAGATRIAFQQVAELPEPTWPEGPRPQMLHLDLTVPTVADLDAQHDRAIALGARLLRDRSGDPDEPLRVYADLAGHPFCIFVAPPASHD
jgi:catechol 2,3-dioxygenase-like lactoylglutathione lyase family enzyme